MTTSTPRVLVIGAGLGGLCLAHGLRAAGVEVAVYERDPGGDIRRQGYRIHLDTRAARGLHACLPDKLYDLFLATCGTPSTQMTVVTKHLKQLKAISFPPLPADDVTALNTSVDRLTLRSVLLTGLREDVIHFGHEFTGYEQRADGTVLAHFANGATATGDVLVAADGAGSRVRAQYLPEATLNDLGSCSIIGRIPLTDATRELVPPVLDRGFAAVVGSRKLGMALGALRFRTRPDLASPDLPRVDDYVMWALTGDRDAFPDNLSGLVAQTGAQLREVATDMVERWHPMIQGLVATSPVEDVFTVPLRSSEPTPAWPASNITLLGDAIHAMSPARGSGANIALMDAGKLCRALVDKPGAPVEAIAAYEAQMREYGFAAVRDTLGAARQGKGLIGALVALSDRFRR